MGYCIHQVKNYLKVKEGMLEELKNILNKKERAFANWELNLSKSGHFVDMLFCGQIAGWGEEGDLVSIANCFENGSWIEMAGEDGARWRYVFNEGQMKTIYPKIIWEEHDGTFHVPQAIGATFDVEIIKEGA